MNKNQWLIILGFVCLLGVAAVSTTSVMVNSSTKALVYPTNFFVVNSNLLNQAVLAGGGGGSDFGTNNFTVTTNFTFDVWNTNGSRCANLTAQVLLAPLAGFSAEIHLIVEKSGSGGYTNNFLEISTLDSAETIPINQRPIFHTILSPGARWMLTNSVTGSDPASIVTIQNAVWPTP